MEKLLPPEIALEIFYRLSPESVVQCKLVCKSWYSLLPRGRGDDDGNYFANMNLRRRQHHQQQHNLDDYSTLNFISLVHQSRSDHEEEELGSVVGKFHFTEYDDEVEGLNFKVKKLVFTQICISGSSRPMSTMRLVGTVGSCNGLLCFTITYSREGTTDFLKDRIIICNPLLHEYVTLPLSVLQFNTEKYNWFITGFGHNPITDEYKVVRVCYSQYSYYIGDVEVYTLGKTSSNGAAGMWRSKETIKKRLWGLPQNVLINGSIHWLADKPASEQNIIVSFDLEDEKFRMIRLPSTNYLNVSYMPQLRELTQLRELRGCLCLCLETRDDILLPVPDQNINLDIWVLKDYMNKESSWVKEFSIKWVIRYSEPWYSPVAIKKNKKDGDAIIICWCTRKEESGNSLVSYDPKTQKIEMVGGRQDVNYWSIFNSVLHINSLVSLKALGEDAKYAEESQSCFVEGSWKRRKICTEESPPRQVPWTDKLDVGV